MKKRLLAILLAVSLAAGIGGESVYAAQTEEKPQETVEPESQEKEEKGETIVGKSYGAGSSMATATSISLGSKVSGVISETNDKDYYKITVPSSSSIQLNLKITSYMEYVYLGIYNGEGEAVLSKTKINWNSNISQITEDYTVYLNPGTYYIGVMKYSSYTGSYTFQLSYTALNNLDLQSDDTIATAHAIPLTTSFTGVLAEDEESDIYKLNVTAAGIVECKFNAYMRRVYLKIFDEDGNELRSENPHSNESIGYSTNTYQFALEKGTYYIQVLVDHFWNDRGKYTISTKYTNIGSDETGANDTIQTADTLSMYKKIMGLMALGETSDVYKVVVSKSGDVPIILKAYMNAVYIKLYNSKGEQLASENPYRNGSLGYSNNTYTYTLSKGTYYIQILACMDYRGKYQLQVGTKPSVSNATITSIKNKTYTGKSITPSITVKYNGKTLKKNTDYTVSYKNNKNIGTATVTVTGKGSYTGTKKVTFKIVPKTVSLTSVKNNNKKTAIVKWKKITNASGYEVYRSTKKSSGYKKVTTITKNKTVSYKNTKLTKGKTYYYKVRAYKKVGNKKYYGNFSSVKAIKIKK